ncbi:MAG: hypothetical protein HGA44_04005, partial [Cellulomonadaceae bacterium]|nr:hypothetical protein [Cellulomonadaceae bacterium]
MALGHDALVPESELRQLILEYLEENEQLSDDVPTERDERYEQHEDQDRTAEVQLDPLEIDDDGEDVTVTFTATREIRRAIVGQDATGDGLDRVTEAQPTRVSGTLTVTVDV